jgi:putative CocE/NonD family hydrolase
MRVEWNAPIVMDDGLVLRADIFRPVGDGRHPIILTYGPYAKGLAFQDGYPSAWTIMAAKHPEVPAGSSNLYQSWEVVDPEKWVSHGYACVRVDSRGCGCSPGYIDHFSPREQKDYVDCIEWAGAQPWSSGKVGLNGISYYGINQWHVAKHKPRHLAAMCIWEGAADWYRDMTHHGGSCRPSGRTGTTCRSRRCNTAPVSGGAEAGCMASLSAVRKPSPKNSLPQIAATLVRRSGPIRWMTSTTRRARPSGRRSDVPFLSAANWGGQGLHPRGNFEGFMRAASADKWLEVHGLEHWTHFYTDYGRELQLRFFDHFLKGEDNGWDRQPRVLLQVRHPGERFVERPENEWPLARTQWTKLHLDPASGTLADGPTGTEAALSFEAMGDGLTFVTPPLERETEVTGPLAAKLFVSSSTADADIFSSSGCSRRT